MTKVYIYIHLCVLCMKICIRMMIYDDHRSLSCSTQINLFLQVVFASQLQFRFFASNPNRSIFKLERENQLSTVTLWSRRPDVKLTLFASAASSALLQLFSCMSCETVGLHPSLKYIRENYSSLPYPSQRASPKIQSAFLHPKMQISALGLLSLK